MNISRIRKRVCQLASVVIICLAGGMAANAGESHTEIQSVLKSYLRATYARNSDESYGLLTSADKAEKSLETYRTENGSFSGAVLMLSEVLAKAIRFGEFNITQSEKKAIVTFSVGLPDANAAGLKSIVEGFDKKKLGLLDTQALSNKVEQLNHLATTGALPMIESVQEQWELLQENGQWRVFVNWSEAVEVNFDAKVMNELGWEFEPLQSLVLAQPGQTIEMAYRVKNTGPVETTGKARHIIGPEKSMEYLEIVSCFCFFEQTLAPDEEMEMPLVFRVSYDAPVSAKQFSVKYEFYPLDSFPGDQPL